MPTKRQLEKEAKITQEIERLQLIFKNLDANKLDTVKSLISTAAFQTVLLEDLQEEINKKGHTETYNNGGGQKGRKQSETMKTHIAITKNHATIMKLLAELAPPAPKKEKSGLQKFAEAFAD